MSARAFGVMIAACACLVPTACQPFESGSVPAPEAGPSTADSPDGGSRLDAPPGDGDGAVPFCDAKPSTFCDDFDQDLPLTQFSRIWQQQYVESGTSVGRASEVRQSAPYGFVASVPPANYTSDPSAAIVARLPAANGFVLEFEFFVSVLDAAGRVGVVVVDFAPELAIALRIAQGQLAVAEIVPGDVRAFGGASVPTHRWMHVRLDLQLGGSPSVTLGWHAATEAETLVVDRQSLDARFVAAASSLTVGARYATRPTSGWTLHIDDVAIAMR